MIRFRTDLFPIPTGMLDRYVDIRVNNEVVLIGRSKGQRKHAPLRPCFHIYIFFSKHSHFRS